MGRDALEESRQPIGFSESNQMAREITCCLSYPLVLTRTCANRCGYCRFPILGPERLPSLRVVRRHLREAARLDAIQVELIAGEGLATHSDVAAMARYLGFDSYQSYLTRILEMIEATDRRSHLFSLLNLGPLSLAELLTMRPLLCAMRIMLESADPSLEFREAHRESPSKLPDRRLEAILCCGKANVPLTTGILVGIGETRTSRLTAFDIIAEAHERYGHIQAVRIQLFHPAPGTPMAEAPSVSDNEFLETVSLAARRFGPYMPIQVSAEEHPHLIGRLLDAGVSDFGDLSVRRSQDPNAPTAALVAMMAAETQARHLNLVQRFPVFSPYCSSKWYPGGFPRRLPLAHAILFGGAIRLSHTHRGWKRPTAARVAKPPSAG